MWIYKDDPGGFHQRVARSSPSLTSIDRFFAVTIVIGWWVLWMCEKSAEQLYILWISQ
jgi:hypothetical protein